MKNLSDREVFLRLFVTTNADKDVMVTITTPIFDSSFSRILHIRKGQIKKIQLENTLEGSIGIEKKGICVVADEDIAVYATNEREVTMDAFLILPTSALGLQYYVTSFPDKTSFMIVATENNTVINISFGKNSPSVSIAGYNIGPETSNTIRLNKFETFLFIQQLVTSLALVY